MPAALFRYKDSQTTLRKLEVGTYSLSEPIRFPPGVEVTVLTVPRFLAVSSILSNLSMMPNSIGIVTAPPIKSSVRVAAATLSRSGISKRKTQRQKCQHMVLQNVELGIRRGAASVWFTGIWVGGRNMENFGQRVWGLYFWSHGTWIRAYPTDTNITESRRSSIYPHSDVGSSLVTG